MSDGVAQTKQQIWRLVFALRFERLSAEGKTPKEAGDEAGRAASGAAKESEVRYRNWLDEVR